MKKLISCDQFETGVCRRLTSQKGEVVYCPPERARHAPPGECCHHPRYRWREKLTEMSRAGVKLRRYGDRLKDPEFLDRLYRAFLNARARRST